MVSAAVARHHYREQMKLEAFNSNIAHYHNSKFVGGKLQADTVKECQANSSLTSMCSMS